MSNRRPYKAKSLKAAEREVNRCRRRIDALNQELQSSVVQSRLVAKLAADGPCFDNPITVYNAKKLRDVILSEIGLNPDGTRLERKDSTP